MKQSGETPGGRRWRNRTVVREQDRQRVLGSWRTVVAILLAILPVGSFLLCSNDCLEVSYSVSAFQLEYERLLKEEQQLKVERGTLTSLPQIEDWARQNGLERPRPDQRLVVRGNDEETGRLVARAPDRRQ